MPDVSAQCEVCGKELAAKTSGRRAATGRPARYCSSACRQRAYRQRSLADTTDGDYPGGQDEAAGRPAVEREPPENPAGNLPVPLDGFIGRENELAEIDRLLRRARLLTLLGPGGAGKTRLALALGERLRAAYPDGVWLVELGRVTGGELVAQTVAAALGVVERSGAEVTETLAGALSGRRMLLLLDNCEHVTESSARLAEKLLRRCPELRVVATSREALRVAGEVTFRVGELSLPAPDAEPSRVALLASDAVRLFVERARAGLPDFELTADNAEAVAGICVRLDGIPLAIELAARRVRLLPVTEILTRLEDRFGFLTTGSRTAEGRHRDLRAAITWSYELLEPAEQAVLRRLSVLVGGFDLDAATAVCADGDVPAGAVLDLVSDLEAKSLIVPETGSGNHGRFRQLESIRLYGRERLDEAGELAETHERLLGWLATLAEPLTDQTLLDRPEVLARINEERDNLLHAVDWATAKRDERQALLAAALVTSWRERGHVAEGRKLLAGALAAIGEEHPHHGIALVLAGWLAAWQGDYEEALRLAEDAVRIERGRNHPIRLAKALRLLAFTQSSRGEVDAAMAATTECLRLVTPPRQPMDEAVCLHYLTCMEMAKGNLDAAHELLAKCLPVYRVHAEPWQLAALLFTGGTLALDRGDVALAESLYREGMPDETSTPSYLISMGMESMAVIAAEHGEPERVLRLMGAADQLRPAGSREPEPDWQRRVDAVSAAARERLPDRVARAAYAAGGRLSQRQALGYALDGVWPGSPGSDPEDAGSSPLTRRELDVAGLVARGLTNRQIAGRLRVAERTVESHLEHIRAKLDLRSRAQIAAWAAEQGTLSTR